MIIKWSCNNDSPYFQPLSDNTTIIKEREKTLFSRKCSFERETNQYLGRRNKTIEQGKYVWGEREGEWKIVKHFRY